MLHLPSTQIDIRNEHRVFYLALRTEHNEPDRPNKPMLRARYIAKGAEESVTPADPKYTWVEPIDIEHGQKVIIGVHNPEPDSHPDFTPHDPTLPRGFMRLYRAMEEYVSREKRLLEEGVGAVVVEWTNDGDVTERIAKIEAGQGDAKRYIWWELIKCDVY
jgi:hypothetical protein